MASDRSAAILRDTRILFDAGTVAGLTDGQLLERFTCCQGEVAEVAFGALVARHGPMVLGVCRRILTNPHDAEDAFQATFLVLIRRAGSVSVGDSLAHWLYGVSYRVAVRARTYSARRRARETSGVEVLPGELDRNPDVHDLRAAIDAELARLPERYRSPVVLCHLGGLSHEEAARQLRCPVGTIKSRLARGREQLRERLIRRGLSPECGLPGVVLIPGLAPGVVPTALVNSTIQAALWLKSGKASAVGVVSAWTMGLTKEIQREMIMYRMKVVATAILGVGCIAGGVRGFAQQDPATERVTKQPPVVSSGDLNVDLGNKAIPKFVEFKALPGGKIGITAKTPGNPAQPTILEALPGNRLRIATRSEDGKESLIECSTFRLDLGESTIHVMSPGPVMIDHSPGEPAPAPTTTDQESRLREMERKLDQILHKLDGPKPDAQSRPPR